MENGKWKTENGGPIFTRRLGPLAETVDQLTLTVSFDGMEQK